VGVVGVERRTFDDGIEESMAVWKRYKDVYVKCFWYM
jgi:hypothetical protein